MPTEKEVFKLCGCTLNAADTKKLQRAVERLGILREVISSQSDMVEKYFSTIDKAASIGAEIAALIPDEGNGSDGPYIEVFDYEIFSGFDEYDRGSGVYLVNAWVPSNFTC